MTQKQPQLVPVPAFELAKEIIEMSPQQMKAALQFLAGYDIDACRKSVAFGRDKHPDERKGT